MTNTWWQLVGRFRRRLTRTQRPITAVVVVGLVAVPTWIFMPTDAWSALGGWMGAAGSVLAVAIALQIAQSQADARATRERAEDAEREIEQARLVTVEMVYPTPEQRFQYEYWPDHVRITNHSAKPIFHPRVERFVHQNGGTTTWTIDDPMDTYDGAPTFLQGAGMHDLVPVDVTYDPPITPDMYPVRTLPIIGFVDSEGRRWRRTGSATPVRVSSTDNYEVGGPSWYRADPEP